jgi:hypothetical protein
MRRLSGLGRHVQRVTSSLRSHPLRPVNLPCLIGQFRKTEESFA